MRYAYAHPSTLTEAGLNLATSGGSTLDEDIAAEEAVFFSGFVENPAVVARGILTVADIAAKRFYVPMTASKLAAMFDPVVTSTDEGLRFESFSGCCGVYARLDISGLDAQTQHPGVTNVDINQPLRLALAGLSHAEPLHLSVGGDALQVTTLDQRLEEKKVDLPLRWVKGLAESQRISAGLTLRHELSVAQARKLVTSLPTSTTAKSVLWATPAMRSWRLASKPSAGAVCLAGAERLRTLLPLMPYAGQLRVYSADVDAGSPPQASAWVLDLPGARFTLVLSPEKTRGFSGEGSLLISLSNLDAADDADLISAVLAFEPRIDIPALAKHTGLTQQRVDDGLQVLAALGQVGFDLSARTYFHRPLPLEPRVVSQLNSRLVNAEQLLATHAVVKTGEQFEVRSKGNTYTVVLSEETFSCTCYWFAKHKDTRGPCKHVLAARLVDQG